MADIKADVALLTWNFPFFVRVVITLGTVMLRKYFASSLTVVSTFCAITR